MLARSAARQLKIILKERELVQDVYAVNLFTGIRDASKFAIDRKHRLYKETRDAKMTVTQANVVTATKRASETES